MFKKSFVLVLTAIIILIALSACQPQTPTQPIRTESIETEIVEAVETVTSTSTPMPMVTVEPMVITPTIQSAVVPTATVNQLINWYGSAFTATIKTYYPGDEQLEIQVYENRHLVSEGVQLTNEEGWIQFLQEDSIIRYGQGQFVAIERWERELLCFVYATPLTTQTRIDPTQLEGQYLTVQTTRACGGHIVIVNGMYAYAEDLKVDGEKVYVAGLYTGYWHWESGWSNVYLSQTQRVRVGDERVMELHQALLAAVDWDSEFDIAGGPIEACLDLKEFWFQVPGTSVNEIEKLCGKMIWSDRYQVIDVFQIRDWEIVVAKVTPGEFEYGIPRLWDGITIETEKTNDCLMIDFSVLTKGEIQHGQTCAPHGSYLNFIQEKYEPCWDPQSVCPTYVTRTYYIP